MLKRNWRSFNIFSTNFKLWNCHFLTRIITSDKPFTFYTLLIFYTFYRHMWTGPLWTLTMNTHVNTLLTFTGKLPLLKACSQGCWVPIPYFMHDFWNKWWLNFIVWLPLLFEVSGKVIIAIVSVPTCDTIAFEIYLSFLIKPFSYITKKINIKM